MTTIKTRISILISGVCASVLAFLGFGCSDNANLCMYGSPYSTFEVKGKVTAEDGTPVANATVRITDPDTPSGISSLCTTTTKKDGSFRAAGNCSGNERKSKVVCIPEDASLDADSVVVDMDYKSVHSKDSWLEGHSEATVDLILKKKTGE